MQIDLCTRQQAEQRIDELKVLPGFASSLCHLALDAAGTTPAVRQLAAVVLKQFIKRHWEEWDDDEEPMPQAQHGPSITICDDEKAAIRAALPSGLADPSTRLRTAVSMAIAGIAQWDWPEQWPSLMRELVAPLQAATVGQADASDGGGASSAAVAGALRCLELCAAELQEEHVGEALGSLMPLLLALVNAPTPHPRRERARAVRVLHKLLERMCTLCSDEPGVRRLQKSPLLSSWVQAALGILEASAASSPATTAECSLEMASLRLLRRSHARVSNPRALPATQRGLKP